MCRNCGSPPADPVLSAAETRLRRERILAGLPDGNKVDDLIDELAECERWMISPPARTSVGWVARLSAPFETRSSGSQAADLPGTARILIGARRPGGGQHCCLRISPGF